MKRIYFLLALLSVFSCSENQSIPVSEPVKLKKLKKVNSTEFNQEGKPSFRRGGGLPSTEFFYNSESNIDSIYHIQPSVGWITPTFKIKYSYDNFNRISMIRSNFVSDFHPGHAYDSYFEYNGNIVRVFTEETYPGDLEDYSSEEILIFEDETYKKLLEVKTTVYKYRRIRNTTTERKLNQIFQYNEDNLINVTTDFFGLRKSMTFEYDDKNNPFLYLKQEPSFVYDHFIEGIIEDTDSPLFYGYETTLYRLDRNIKWMLRNSQNNVLNYTITSFYTNSTVQDNFSNEYTYDEEDYPTFKNTYKNNSLNSRVTYIYN